SATLASPYCLLVKSRIKFKIFLLPYIYLKVEPSAFRPHREMSVLLPCQFSGFIPDDPTVMWTRNDLVPKSVHVQHKEGDDFQGQNQRYRGRTKMRPDALDTSDFSLTLRKPEMTDSGNYTCSISGGRGERTLEDVELQIKGQQKKTTPAVITHQKLILCTENLHRHHMGWLNSHLTGLCSSVLQPLQPLS
uniref:Ig-like domain-containing protein n=1 Tax=Oreochromis aureus TaxID=47969 RepID=A0AAZ1XVB9_OREAU